MPYAETIHNHSIRYTDVSACLAAIVTLADARWKPGVVLNILAESNLPRVECDPATFQDTVLQLLSNAADAMPDGGSITMKVAAARKRPNTLIEVSVTDSGIGMSRDTVNRAFDPFFTTKGKGLGGLGLPSAKRFVEDHGGNIEIRSTPGSGTTVTMRVPGLRLSQSPTR